MQWRAQANQAKVNKAMMERKYQGMEEPTQVMNSPIETVNEFINRGGIINTIPPRPNKGKRS